MTSIISNLWVFIIKWKEWPGHMQSMLYLSLIGREMQTGWPAKQWDLSLMFLPECVPSSVCVCVSACVTSARPIMSDTGMTWLYSVMHTHTYTHTSRGQVAALSVMTHPRPDQWIRRLPRHLRPPPAQWAQLQPTVIGYIFSIWNLQGVFSFTLMYRL